MTDVPTTLPGLVRARAAREGSRTAFVVLANGEELGEATSYARLDARAASVAAELRDRGAAGGAVLLLCEAGIDYVAALLGCMYAGAVAVPAYAPTRAGLARAGERIAAVARDCGARFALVTREVRQRAPEQLSALGLEAILEVDSLPDRELDAPLPGPGERALLQYTSGSTATPKGVIITHQALAANLQLATSAGAVHADDVTLSWLPPYHDMGLIGGVLSPLFLGARGVLMPPDAFLRRPRRWLSAASTHRATMLMAPNFAFDLCVRRIPPEERTGLDLSCVKLIYDGAEPIDARVVERFVEAFAPHGLSPNAIYPSYGMAEATLIISAGRPGRGLVARDYDARALELHEARAAARAEGSLPSRRLVGCGSALPGERIEIVDPETLAALPERHVGEIWVQSPSLAAGYHGQPEATARAFDARTQSGEGPFLRTGDLGFFDGGELFISGRLKDLIIVHGRNHYPHDLERTVQSVDEALCVDGGAAFSVAGEGSEQLVIVQELDKREGAEPQALLARAAEAVREQHGLSPLAIVLIRRGTVLKTASGKIRRRAVKEAYEQGRLEVVARWPVVRPGLCLVRPEEPEPGATMVSRSSPVAEPPLRSARNIARWLREEVAHRVKLAPESIDEDAPLAQHGIDSVAAAELAEAAEQRLGVPVPSTLPYDHPTLSGLASALAQRVAAAATLGAGSATAAPMPNAVSPAPAPTQEPIAIVGMACRFPGARSLAEYWQLLRYGIDAVTEVPPERWDIDALYAAQPGVSGKMCSRTFGFVEGIDQFDAAFFGISSHEADRMDPQQRMFLELCWEALEHAGVAPTSLAGSLTGVFAGVATHDYAALHAGHLGLVGADYGTGNAAGLVPNRVSYTLDLRGPSETVDCACASSLVALRHACRSLREAECDLALAGGVNAILTPEASVYFSQVGALSQQGRCKTFDKSADGFTRGEGAGVLVLKRLSSALADGDTVYAVIAGEAVSQSGRTNGLMAPSGRAQREVIERALAAARLTAADMDYVEAHGVGTKVSDAVEIAALGEVMRGRSRDEPLLLGSVKTNIGHLEAAAGVASVIKVALALHHQELPPHLHLREPSSELRLETLPLEIPTVNRPWRRCDRPRVAGVSAFGFGGTNAHVVMCEAPQRAPSAEPASRREHILTLSARTDTALLTLARRLRDRLAERPDELADVAYTLATGRAHFARRLAVRAHDVDEARARLEAFCGGRPTPGVQLGDTPARPEVVFVFGEVPVRPGYGRDVSHAFAPCRQALEHCEELLQPTLGGSLLQTLYGSSLARAAQRLAQPSFAHAAVVAWHYALWTFWTAAGLEPVAVFGSGVGEYSAAAAAGVLSWDRALLLAARRGLVREGLAPGAEQRMTVHALRRELSAQQWASPSVPVLCASLADGQAPDAAHFARHLYHEVKPAEGRAALGRCDATVLLSMSTSLGLATRSAHELASLDPLGSDLSRLLDTLGALYVAGAHIDWVGLEACPGRPRVQLPTYPFERERHWIELPLRESYTPYESQVVAVSSMSAPRSEIRVQAGAQDGETREATVAFVPASRG